MKKRSVLFYRVTRNTVWLSLNYQLIRPGVNDSWPKFTKMLRTVILKLIVTQYFGKNNSK